MAREASFNFIPANQAVHTFAEGTEWRVTIGVNPLKSISFPASHPETKKIIGRFLQFFVDTEKNSLGWKVFEEGELSDLKNVIKVTLYNGSICRLSIAKALNALDLREKSYKQLIVKKSRPQGLLNDGKVIHYVEIERPVRKYNKRDGSKTEEGKKEEDRVLSMAA